MQPLLEASQHGAFRLRQYLGSVVLVALEMPNAYVTCLLYTSDAADEMD